MPTEVVAGLNVAPGDVVLDCTAGRGGHAALLATAAGEDGTIVLCDLDPGNLEFAAERVQTTGPIQVKPFQGSFARVPEISEPRAYSPMPSWPIWASRARRLTTRPVVSPL